MDLGGVLSNHDFNSRPSARGDVRRRASYCSGGVFQFTPLREGRPDSGGTSESTETISIHAPPRGATTCTYIHLVVPKFQFTPLREGRPFRPTARASSTYFNSRPSARGDSASTASGAYADISIHAPPRGATRKGVHVVGVQQISIHAPPRGATIPYYNAQQTAMPISIHAPPRGATKLFAALKVTAEFQFTPLREGRHS